MSAEYSYRDITGLSWILIALLGVGVVEAAVSVYSSSRQLELLDRPDPPEAEAEANDARQQAIGFINLGVYLTTVVCFGIWIVRANRNVRACGASNLPITPGWAVGYFFVPILNLFRPYQAMRDLLKASRDPAKWWRASGSPILPLWWALWLASNVTHHIAFRISLGATSVQALREATKVQLLAELMDVPLCLAAIGVVLLIARAQQSMSAITPPLEWPMERWNDNAQEDDRIVPENS